jgi:phosphate/sulfate permease
MSEEKSTVPAFVASIMGAALLIAGISRANKNNTSTWMEILNILKDIALWVFAILFALFIIYVIYFLVKVTLERICAAYIMWEKSQVWCDKVESSHQKTTEEIQEFRTEMARYERILSNISTTTGDLKESIGELKKVSPSVVEAAVANAEEEILGNG